MSRTIKLANFLSVAILGVFASAPTAGAAGLEDFGRCLTRQGATFYGASWCPHCRAQQQTLGEAMPHVRYVECSVDGGRGGTAAACISAKVDSFPTWIFSDGSRASGARSLADLASRTGCRLPSAGGKPEGPPNKSPDSAKRVGPKIIEVPRE